MLLPIRHARWITGAIGLTLGMSLLSVGEGRAATATMPTAQQLSTTVEFASRVRLRLGSRPVRYRLGAFRRGASCLQDEAELVPLIPDVTETEAEAGDLPPELSVPVDATTLSHPAFFVYVPPLEAETTAQFTLQTNPDNLSAVEELVSVRFPITAEGGVIGIYLPESSPGLEEEQQYYWQMAVKCDAEELTENPVVSGWVRRVTAADLPSPPSTVVSAVLFYAEQGIWQNALTILATERYDDPGDRALSQTWTDLLTAAGLETLAEAPLAQQINLTVPAAEEETSTESPAP